MRSFVVLASFTREAGSVRAWIVSPLISPLTVKQEVVSSPLSPFAGLAGDDERKRVFHTRSVPSEFTGVKKVAADKKAARPRRRRWQALVYNPKRERKKKDQRRLAKARRANPVTECVTDDDDDSD